MAMTPEQYDEQRARVLHYWHKWRDTLGLDEWNIRLDFFEGQYVMQDGDASGTAVASCFVRWEYRHANVAWNLDKVAEQDEEALELHVVHEAMHILLNEMREDSIKHEERVAQSLAFAFLRTTDGGEEAE